MVENKVTKQRTLVGRVTSNKMDKTIVVLVERHERHAVYKKTIMSSNKVHAHDEGNQCQIGDKVLVGEIKPMSKTKTWALLEVIERAQ